MRNIVLLCLLSVVCALGEETTVQLSPDCVINVDQTQYLHPTVQRAAEVLQERIHENAGYKWALTTSPAACTIVMQLVTKNSPLPAECDPTANTRIPDHDEASAMCVAQPSPGVVRLYLLAVHQRALFFVAGKVLREMDAVFRCVFDFYTQTTKTKHTQSCLSWRRALALSVAALRWSRFRS